MTWDEAAREMKAQGMGDTAIADSEVVRAAFPDLNDRQRREKVRGLFRDRKKRKPGRTVVGVLGDLHTPFAHPNYLQFCADTFKAFGVNRVVFIGDIFDQHTLSFHPKEPQAMGTQQERAMAQTQIRGYFEAFPEADIVIGNHDERVFRIAASVGLDRDVLKPLNEIYGLPKKWRLHDEIIIDNVLYKHGVNCGGKDGALTTALTERMSTVIGHYHSGGGVKYSANKRDIIFGMNVGCGIDIGQYAFVYGKHDKFRPTLGCGVVFGPTNAIFVPMGDQYFRN